MLMPRTVQLHCPINAEIRLLRANQIREFCYSYGFWDLKINIFFLLFFFVNLISVVKLFNAVSKHQKEVESKLSSAPTEAKKSKGEGPE